ncbi:AAWKG family protein [Streptomyces griseorubiginosus]|uniref:AAWKG family protein n=1 Tax=Streptomyces griseorubiginosus TaxID=67304 RepID=UPI0036CAEAD8
MPYDQDDYWGQAVTLFTGYPMPSRATLFDKLKSKEGIPLFRMDIRSESMRKLSDADYTAISGWHVASGDDYILTFVGTSGGKDGSGHKSDDFNLYKAHIVFIGVFLDGNGRARLLDAGETFSGTPFTGHYGDQWDNTTLGQYVSGAKAALDALAADSAHSTAGFSYNGASVADKDAVKLKSFEQTAQSFDRTKKFFADQAVVLKQWEDSLGGDDSAWQGQAAGVFRDLVHQLRKNYDAYVEQMGGATYTAQNTSLDYYTPRSPYSDALIKAQKDLWRQTLVLRTAWIAWANTGRHDPHRGLLEILDELTAWVLANNVHQVGTRQVQGSPRYEATSAFKQSHPVYGNLNDVNNWKKVGEAAVQRWTTYIESQLIPFAKQAMSDLNNAWIAAIDPLEEPLDAKDTSSLTDQYEHHQNGDDEGNGSTDDFRQSLDDALNNLNTGINNSISGLGDNLSGVGDGLNGLGDSLTGLGDNLGTGLNDLTTGLGAGLNGLTSNLGAGLGNLSDLNTGLTSNLGDGLNLGSGLGTGLTNPGGGTTTLNPDGTLTTTYPDGSVSIFDPSTGKVTTTTKDGKSTTTDLDAGDSVTNPDGSVTTLNPDGTLTTKYPDGTVTTVDPATGVATTTDPDGHVTTTDLGSGLSGLGDPGHGLDLGNLDDFDHLSDSLGSLNSNLSGLSHSPGTGSGTPLTSGLTGLGGLGSLSGPGSLGGGTTGSNGLLGPSFEGYDDSPYTSGALGAPTGSSAASAESGAANGMPMMPMGGMGGAPGAAGGQSGTGERVRNVLTEPGAGGPLGGRSRRTGRNRSTEDDEAEGPTTGRARVSTSSTGSPFAPQSDAGRRDGRRTESSGAEERASWLADEEDEDVWGADEGGAPSVIGR